MLTWAKPPGKAPTSAFAKATRRFHVVGQLSVVDVLADHVAKDAPEILVTWKGKKTATVGQHADEAAQQPHAGQSIDLLLHAVFLIQKPPGGTELHFTFDGTIVVVADHGSEHFVVAGVEVVEDGFGQLVFIVQTVEQLSQGKSLLEIADAVEASIRIQFPQHPGTVVAQRTEVKLLYPAFFCVSYAQVVEHGGHEFARLQFGNGLPSQSSRKNSFHFGFGVILGVDLVQAVIGQTTAVGVEEIHALV